MKKASIVQQSGCLYVDTIPTSTQRKTGFGMKSVWKYNQGTVRVLACSHLFSEGQDNTRNTFRRRFLWFWGIS